MDVNLFIQGRRAEGVSHSAAVRELAAITGSGVRSVWRWLNGGEVPPYARRLLTVWHECSPEQRSRWFGL